MSWPPVLKVGRRYPFRVGGGHVEILGCKDDERAGRCCYVAWDTRNGRYEQNDFAMLNKIDCLAHERADQLAFDLERAPC